jgi:uncharacterized protein (DUF305 family)
MIDKNILTTSLVSAVVGVLGTLAFVNMRAPHEMAVPPALVAPQAKMHMMPNGEMMGDMPMPAHEMSGDMGGMMMDMMAGLKGKTGDEFDKAFLEEMIVHHQGAVDMAEAVLTESKRPELVKFARDIISAQSKEITMQKAWLSAWFPKE